jgi:hypothetical protein
LAWLILLGVLGKVDDRRQATLEAGRSAAQERSQMQREWLVFEQRQDGVWLCPISTGGRLLALCLTRGGKSTLGLIARISKMCGAFDSQGRNRL